VKYKKLKNSELSRKSIQDFKSSLKTPLIIVLDNIRSLNNIGSVFRTSDAFLIEEVLLCGITGTPPHKDIQKTALGSTESVIWKYYKSTVDSLIYLKNKRVKIYAIEQTFNSISLKDFKIDSDLKYAFVLGNEINGVSQEVINLCEGVIEVPQIGTKHSLNIAVCNGIITWDFFQKLKR
tara:strand:+ start:2300 stop:2836 length:537 start_codon:yes stop_codon:yes gene_type:complete